jgi:hypothetical protein
MKAYGFKLVELTFDTKKSNRYYANNNAVYSSVGTRNALRTYKKAARREAKGIINSQIGE